MENRFPCYLVRKSDQGEIQAGVEEVSLSDLPPGDVLIRVAYSSLNYKDALAATGHPGVARQFPHVPGIDAAGTVVESSSDQFSVGQEVLVTGYGLGEQRWGGWASYTRVPEDYVVPLPPGLTLLESMIYGTAGFTAAQSALAIMEREIEPDRGPVVVTGATGGVGTFAVAFLAQAGYQVAAVTGKPAASDYLKQLGASEILGRGDVDDRSGRPLLSTRWSAAVDTVGGNILGTLLRSTMHRAVVTACGLVAGAELDLTVYPFLLRGVNLVGIDSAKCPMLRRLAIWQKLAGPWKPKNLDRIATIVPLAEIAPEVEKILKGGVQGRIVLRCGI